MYLLKTINLNLLEDYVKIIDGLECFKIDNSLIPVSSFWGKSEINLGKFIDWDKIQNKDETYILSYVNEYIVEDNEDNYKTFKFNVSTFQPEKIEGYILFVPYTADKLYTSGEKIFGRYYDEIVVVLRNNDELEFNNRKFKVIDNKLVMYI